MAFALELNVVACFFFLCLFSSFLTLISSSCRLFAFLLTLVAVSLLLIFHRFPSFSPHSLPLANHHSGSIREFHTCLDSVCVVLFFWVSSFLLFRLSCFLCVCFIRMWCVPLHVMMIFRCLIFLSAALCRDFVKAKLSHASCKLNVPNQSPQNFLQSAKNNNNNYNNNKKFSKPKQKNARNARRKLIYRWRKKRD